MIAKNQDVELQTTNQGILMQHISEMHMPNVMNNNKTTNQEMLAQDQRKANKFEEKKNNQPV